MIKQNLKAKLSKIVCTLCNEYSEIDNRCAYFTSYEACPMFNIVIESLMENGIGDVSEYKHRVKKVEKELADLKTEMLHKYNFGVKVLMEDERLQLKIKVVELKKDK